MNDAGLSPPAPSTADRLAILMATGLAAGYFPKAPGTIGALLGLPVAWAIGCIPGVAWQLVAIAGIGLIGIGVCGRAARAMGRGKDPGCIILDEIASMPVVFLLVPLSGWLSALAGFLLFRLFDISKPPPVRQFERLPGGLGIMADDWVAALYSAGILYGLHCIGWV